MFTIFGGATAFTQWQKDQKVTNPNMTAGDPVYFAASNGESYPTRAYISGGDVVADVPNELLTMHKPFTARLDDHDEPVTIFRVEAADKPSGYVYEDNMNKTHAPGDVVIPAGATLTLEEGAKVNDKAGGLGGGSASAGVKYAHMVMGEGQAVDLAPIANTLFPIVSFDSSYDELYDAYQNGVYPVLCVDLSDDGANAINLLPLGAVNLDEGMESLMFSVYISGATYIVSVNKNGEHVAYANLPEF